MDEISKHPFDAGHVENIANLINLYLFAFSPESDEGLQQFVKTERQSWHLPC